MTESPQPAGPPARNAVPVWLFPSLALGLALGSMAAPVLALPAMIVVVLVAARSSGRTRWLVALAGGAASLAGLMRFTVEWAVPNIVSSGLHAAEERAVSRLREILWAEDRVRERGWVDTDGDGVGEHALLGELTGQEGARRGAQAKVPLLRPSQFHALRAGDAIVYRSEGYVFTVYLPGAGGTSVGEGKGSGAVDPRAAAHYWVAYAWPAERGHGGVRAFYIDQDERICETGNAQGYSGAEKVPAADAAIGAGAGPDPCVAPTGDGGKWGAWRNKKPRGAARAR